MTEPAGAGDTIFALSSGGPPAAIGVVRVSGPGAAATMRALAGRLPPPRVATYAPLRDTGGVLLDRALLLWFPGPATATGEDVAELHLHGGRATIAAVLGALGEMAGLRIADPGEFTRRALANGRLDLAQAEGLADLLSAETEGQRRAALRVAEGGLGRLVEGWRLRLLALSATVEAAIEFAEEHDDVPAAPHGVAEDAETLAEELAKALARPPAERLRDGIRIVVAGPVNSGKSSLVNALCGRDVAIATPLPGTTRDLIEVPVILDGVACILIDSAGLRDATDFVERIGVARAEQAIAGADLVLWLGSPSEPPRSDGVIRVRAKSDLLAQGCQDDSDRVAVSARTGEGLLDLRRQIVAASAAILPLEDAIPLNQRHRSSLKHAVGALKRAARLADDPPLFAEELRVARASLDAITGRNGVEEMLDALFSRFCVGK